MFQGKDLHGCRCLAQQESESFLQVMQPRYMAEHTFLHVCLDTSQQNPKGNTPHYGMTCIIPFLNKCQTDRPLPQQEQGITWKDSLSVQRMQVCYSSKEKAKKKVGWYFKNTGFQVICSLQILFTKTTSYLTLCMPPSPKVKHMSVKQECFEKKASFYHIRSCVAKTQKYLSI